MIQAKNIRVLFLTILTLSIIAGCASKRYAKKAAEFEAAGLYKDAANYYYESVKRKDTNVEAKLGLRKNGQLVLEDKLAAFTEAYKTDDTKKAVYNFLEAEKYYNKIKSVGVELNFPEHHRTYYQEVKDQYTHKRYIDGVEKLDREEFAAAQQVFAEIVKISPNYKDAKSKLIIAKYEPVYRQANASIDAGKFRTAYYAFDRILKEAGPYKNAQSLKIKAQEEATITILVPDMQYRGYQEREQANVMMQRLKKELNDTKNPFIKLIEPSALSVDYYDNRTHRYNYEALNLAGVKAILHTELNQIEAQEGKTMVSPKRGYLKNVTKYKDDNGEEHEKVTYKKTSYTEYRKTNSAQLSISYKFISTGDGSVWLSDALRKTATDKVEYARFKGDSNKLVPGYWKYRNKDSSADIVHDNSAKRNALKRLLRNSSDIKTPEQLLQQTMQESLNEVVKKIDKFNPEQ